MLTAPQLSAKAHSATELVECSQRQHNRINNRIHAHSTTMLWRYELWHDEAASWDGHQLHRCDELRGVCSCCALRALVFSISWESIILKGALYHRLEIAVRCFKNPLGALAKSVVGRAMSSCCGRDRNLPSASDICRAGDPSQVLDVRLTHAPERTASFLTGMG
ncbi:hypothetical protein J6590_003938 [Homalodisca vitripennis]|nr:hypothetical protein J6590_003938 [Homalodisca vitripennis]